MELDSVFWNNHAEEMTRESYLDLKTRMLKAARFWSKGSNPTWTETENGDEMADLNEIRKQSEKAAEAVCEAAQLKAGDLFVVGCSSSEVIGERIGTGSSLEAAEAVFEGIYTALQKRRVFLAAQCCEHLNRALIVEREAYEKYDLEEVNVIPQPKAGGSFGTTAFHRFADPVAVESIRQKASAGMDIGGTLIGMHIKPVVVPIRIAVSRIGEAGLICARRRPRFVGGERAVYNDDLL